MIDIDKCKIGTKIIVHNFINPEITTIAEIAYIEYDQERGVLWLYLINKDSLSANNKYDNKFNFPYWDVLENYNPYIRLITEEDSLLF